MPRYRAFIGNLLFLGEQMSPTASGSRRNRTVFKLDRYTMQVMRTDGTQTIPPHKLIGSICHTHDLSIDDIDIAEHGRVREMVVRLCELLAFLTGSQVAFMGDEFRGATFAPGSEEVALSYHPLLIAPRAIREAVEQVFRRFRSLRKRRRLNEVLHLLRLPGRHGTPWEVKLLLVFVALESLKSSYAKSVGYRFSAPAWRKIVHPGVALSSQPKVGFEKLLREMLKRVKMRNGLRQVVALRNHIVHNGVSSMRQRTQEKIYANAQDLLREYVLRLIGYRGEFHAFDPSVQKKITKLYPI